MNTNPSADLAFFTTTRRQSLPALLTVLGSLAALTGFAPAARAGAYDDFFLAIERDDADGLQALLARGMDPNSLDPQGQHGLFLALRGGAEKVFALLLRQTGIAIDTPNTVGETPLMMAALRANLPAMQSLAARGAALDRPGWTSLHYAASSPSAAPVRWLLERAVNVNARAPNGNTPLMLAARYGSEDSVTALLDKGADRSLRNERHLDAADYARLGGREPMARRLEQGAR
jgi:ankyrin repeat protein